MNFDKLVKAFSEYPYFDVPLLVQVSGEPKNQLLVQLHQWTEKGKILRLRRGMYTLSDTFRRVSLSPLQAANEIYKPSYLSGVWALSYYSLIPEKVVHFTSVTTRVTRTFSNSLGIFTYASLKKDFFWGFIRRTLEGAPVWIAEPEKALLDYLHLHGGVWSRERLQEMRFQNTESLDLEKLMAYAIRWASPRLIRTVGILKNIFQEEQEGTIIL